MGWDHGDSQPGADLFAQEATDALRLIDDARRIKPRMLRTWQLADTVHRADDDADLAAGAAIRVDERLGAPFSWLRGRGGHLGVLQSCHHQLAHELAIRSTRNLAHDILHDLSLIRSNRSNRFLNESFDRLLGDRLG